jgi:hypothetical protein
MHAHEPHGIRAVRIRPGHVAVLVNVSACGLLVETHRRLLPGTSVELQVDSDTRQTSVRGQVTRCAVAAVRATSIAYRGAVAFDRHLPWIAADAEPAASPADHRPMGPLLPEREDVTRALV